MVRRTNTASQRGKLANANSLPYEAMAHYEKALSHYPDHPLAIVGLSELLLDIYCQKIAPEPQDIPTFTTISPTTSFASRLGLRTSAIKLNKKETEAVTVQDGQNPVRPPSYAAAARDRAYGLLSTLTKLGTGWDYSEAWFALARAYEESGQIEKAKEVLWWCVELEDTRPIRHWRSLRSGGFGMG
jgi:tetratricopeptide (TPR) repeat protein